MIPENSIREKADISTYKTFIQQLAMLREGQQGAFDSENVRFDGLGMCVHYFSRLLDHSWLVCPNGDLYWIKDSCEHSYVDKSPEARKMIGDHVFVCVKCGKSKQIDSSG